MRIFYFLSLFLVLWLGGCSWLGKPQEQPEADWNVERYYSEAKAALNSGNYQQAITLYEQLEARYPFGVYAQQALLESAYAYYKFDEPESALAALDRFIRLYPLNPHMDYAHYLKGLVNFHRGIGLIEKYIPRDESQRDPESARDALKDFRTLVKRFPDSRYAKDGAQRIVYLRNRLAQHEINVAQYYMRRGAYIGAINRAKYVVENYQRTPTVPEALTIMARGYKVLGLDELAEDTLRVLETNFPGHPGIAQARQIKIIE
ncbi:outer membrane assembly lipoprotein YfiO [Nitrosococcus halophilus Nc 4]|uniref:Outer membrane protein assembly factor BamD n=1 Tax=Nitrosococcus halophilus (strain Nc4) TaxID=472759 RepID=D5BWC5_NITHN|nr:outer membrane protein assembly factor BamD [Nitrosococcus halophilus]ADE13775.1 outer membrane assembly lipoprotein YfiO [Nitrosococcus halophilus Nc 4]